ncbi:hypothetical protein EDD86DRAFT_254977 [Gorgonomyces haynaldii]|nr:hypothetical protein EDD86DRAFT_254977 [Gorgonomyces haynaldii]
MLFQTVLGFVDSDWFSEPQYEIQITNEIQGEPIDSVNGSLSCLILPPISHTAAQETPKIGAVLQRLSSLKCLYAFPGYWSYEFCHMDQLRQFHQRTQNEPINNKVSDQYLLGSHKKLVSSTIEHKTTRGVQVSYLKQIWGGGTLCDLTEQPRYHCKPGNEEYMIPPREISTCRYLVQVYTPVLCTLPTFSTQIAPVSLIQCLPKQFTKQMSMIEYLQKDKPVESKMGTENLLKQYGLEETLADKLNDNLMVILAEEIEELEQQLIDTENLLQKLLDKEDAQEDLQEDPK